MSVCQFFPPSHDHRLDKLRYGMIKSLIFILTISVSFSAYSLESFSSDGCSMYPDGTIHEPYMWAHCCFVHDISYWMGGTRDEREIADEELMACVGETTHLTHGQIVELGVRAGGAPYSIWPWRWGFGHGEIRPYGPLTREEVEQVAQKSGTILMEIESWAQKFNDDQLLYVEVAYRELQLRTSH